MKKKWFFEFLIDPFLESVPLDLIDNGFLRSSKNEFVRYPIYNDSIPIIIDNSIFDLNSILNKVPTTQNVGHSDTKNIKNFIRRRLLPTLSYDNDLKKRYLELISNIGFMNPKVLVLGAGEKSAFYKEVFGEFTVTSDVHLQFGVDVVFDGHFIPFDNEIFDLVLAAQVLEHVIDPFQVSKEIQRVLKNGGIAQIEVPFVFPYHAAPYDFFRFTYSGIRVLFRECKVLKLETPEGLFSAIAITISNALIELSNIALIRSMFLVFSRLTLFWLKYLDRLSSNRLSNKISLPKGYSVTFRKDSTKRDNLALMKELHLVLE